ncbi:2614_t:CDS:1, partial [Gigaspora margarita]
LPAIEQVSLEKEINLQKELDKKQVEEPKEEQKVLLELDSELTKTLKNQNQA